MHTFHYMHLHPLIEVHSTRGWAPSPPSNMCTPRSPQNGNPDPNHRPLAGCQSRKDIDAGLDTNNSSSITDSFTRGLHFSKRVSLNNNWVTIVPKTFFARSCFLNRDAIKIPLSTGTVSKAQVKGNNYCSQVTDVLWVISYFCRIRRHNAFATSVDSKSSPRLTYPATRRRTYWKKINAPDQAGCTC